MPFEVAATRIPEVLVFTPRVFHDDRGFFMETYAKGQFATLGLNIEFVQDNHSRSMRGVLRGLHFQREPFPQGKLVRAVFGRIFDVAVDLRKGSPTYLAWEGVVLDDENRKMLYVPPGFAHGFCVLSDEAEVSYKTTSEFSAEHDSGVRWNDPDIGIDWPITAPRLSVKDAGLPRVRESDIGFVYRKDTDE